MSPNDVRGAQSGCNRLTDGMLERSAADLDLPALIESTQDPPRGRPPVS
ncbi:hypothetical protein ACWEF9_13490 [Streptomyces sp. NPDC004980]